MSLTDFIKTPEVRALFNKTAVGIPSGRLNDRQLVDHIDRDKASLVGTAVDYMIRILLTRYANERGIQNFSRQYTAWMAIDRMKANARFVHLVDELTVTITNCETIFEGIAKGKNIDVHSFVVACCRMARLDIVGRVGLQYLIDVNGNMNRRHEDYDVFSEVMQFIDIIDVGKTFAPRQLLLLNPTFELSSSVGGADGDLVSDDTLFELKTTSQRTLCRNYFEQLAGYAALAEIGGFTALVNNREQLITELPIKNFGLFFSRQNLKLVYSISELFGMFGWEEYVSGFMKLLNLEKTHAA